MKIKFVEGRTDADYAAMEVMADNEQLQNDPMVGSFWFDPQEHDLFGVYAVLADDVNFYQSDFYKAKVRTGRRLHKDIWAKEHFKEKDPRFAGDYTKWPRGRVLEFEGVGFKVYVGDWIDDYPDCEALVVAEFQLPVDTEFVKDIHWNIGHGWSDVRED